MPDQELRGDTKFFFPGFNSSIHHGLLLLSGDGSLGVSSPTLLSHPIPD